MRTVILALVAAALAGCAQDPTPESQAASPPGPPAHVQMMDNQYAPATLRIASGTSVSWTNHDVVRHTVTPADDRAWGGAGSGDEEEDWMPGGATWTYTFARSGSFTYYCIPHAWQDEGGAWQGMVGEIVVV